jgi:Zn-dependent metalloprotease
MKNIRILLWSILMAATVAGYGQGTPQSQAFARIAKPGCTPAWFRLRDETKISAARFFQECKTALGLTDADELRLKRSETDAMGMTHHRYVQFHRNIPVFTGDYILHEKDGRIETANGNLTTGITGNPQPALSESGALDLALSQMPSKNFLWLENQAESALKARSGNPESTYFPKGELMWVRSGNTAGHLDLAWKFDLNMSDGTSETMLIDAASGQVILRFPIDLNCNPGSGATTWNGNQNLSTSKSGGNFILLDDCASPNVHVYNGNDSTSTGLATEYTDADNSWSQSSAWQTFYGLHQARQFYLTTFGRNSYDNGGADIIAYNQAGFKNSAGNTYWSNASWSGSEHVLRFGDNGTASATDDWNTVDVTGHELTHGVTQYSAGLNYSGESGGLNESFSDIFGEMSELFTQGGPDWLVGNQRSPGNIRSFINPKSKSNPDTYLGTFWVSTSGTCNGANDNCGVHTNSGVQNHWFYLLSVGGSGTNDNGDAFNVTGIGTASASAIAYRNLTVYLSSGSSYADAKNGSIQAARDLFGDCSKEVLQTARAWDAVGVNNSDLISYDATIDCPTLNFVHGLHLPYTAHVFNDIRSNCSISPNGTSVVFQAGHVITLKPGFDSGDAFHAFIDPCPGSKPAPGGPETGMDRNQNSVQSFADAKSEVLSAFPNPFNGEITLQFSLQEASKVSFQLNDAFGRPITVWYRDEPLEANDYTVHFNNDALPEGMYYAELKTQAGRWIRKLVRVNR